MKNTIIVLIGPSCAGKSTWAVEYQTQNPTYVILSRDYQRWITFGNYNIQTPRNEALITARINNQVLDHLNVGQDIILDSTHLRNKYLTQIVKDFSSLANIEFITFKEPLLTLIKRNQKRYEETGKIIPLRVLKKQLKNFGLLTIPDNVKHLSWFNKLLNYFKNFKFNG